MTVPNASQFQIGDRGFHESTFTAPFDGSRFVVNQADSNQLRANQAAGVGTEMLHHVEIYDEGDSQVRRQPNAQQNPQLVMQMMMQMLQQMMQMLQYMMQQMQRQQGGSPDYGQVGPMDGSNGGPKNNGGGGDSGPKNNGGGDGGPKNNGGGDSGPKNGGGDGGGPKAPSGDGGVKNNGGDSGPKNNGGSDKGNGNQPGDKGGGKGNPDTTDGTDKGPKPGDNNVPKYDGKVVHIENSAQLENLKIEKGMVVQLDAGKHYELHKGLHLPEGAKIVGDKNNPPSLDYVGPQTKPDGSRMWTNIITVDGPNATIDGIKVESSNMKMGSKGGANGIWAGENADNLTVKNCTTGNIETFVHINGGDNVTVDNCKSSVVNSYFVWNEHGSDNTTIKNSRVNDSKLEWTVRSYGDNLKVENSFIQNVSPEGGPYKGALAVYNGSAVVEDSTINGGMRIGPLAGPIHGVQYLDASGKHIKEGLSAEDQKKAQILYDEVTSLKVTGSTINDWIMLNQNAHNVVFEDNDIHGNGVPGSAAAITEFKTPYKYVRTPATGIFRNNRFTGDIDKPLNNNSGAKVYLGDGNTLNGKAVASTD